VAYRVPLPDGRVVEIRSPQDLPDPGERDRISEPYVKVMIITPTEYVGPVMELATARRAIVGGMNYLSPERVELDFEVPLAEIVFDFFDVLKSKTKGYASLDYEPSGYREADLVKVDILLNGQPVDAFSAIVHRDHAQEYGKRMTGRLRNLIPRQLFDVPIQAAIGGRIISRETVKARRKDVTAKCYGGDITRKKKLLQRQKEGKKRMKMVGSVEVPQEAFVAALKVDEE
jgi:GTP-binding protein LepA